MSYKMKVGYQFWLILLFFFASNLNFINCSTYYFSPNGTTNPSCGNISYPCGPTFQNLKSLVDGDLLLMEPGIYTSSMGLSLNINVNLTIKSIAGDPTTTILIDAAFSIGSTRVATIDSFTFKIFNKPGHVINIGSGVCNVNNCIFSGSQYNGVNVITGSGGHYNITNCSFYNNTYSYAVQGTYGTTANITSCTFNNNTSPNGVINFNNALYIDNCIFFENHGFVVNCGSIFQITNSIFQLNIGGYAISYSSSNPINIINSTFLQNSCTSGSCVTLSSSVLATINSCVFQNNTGTSIHINNVDIYFVNSTIINNSGTTNGAGIYATNSQVNLISGEIVNNVANKGPAIYCAQQTSFYYGQILISGNINGSQGYCGSSSCTSCNPFNCTLQCDSNLYCAFISQSEQCLCNNGYNSATNCSVPYVCNINCANNGTCQLIGSESICSCSDGYDSATNCSTKLCLLYCNNNGNCTIMNNTQQICDCYDGWDSNTNCATQIMAPSSSIVIPIIDSQKAYSNAKVITISASVSVAAILLLALGVILYFFVFKRMLISKRNKSAVHTESISTTHTSELRENEQKIVTTNL